jgi:hypothetical protein
MPGFALTEQNAASVAEICRRLDGLPLAIELAAARCKVLSPQSLAERLTERLTLLTGGPRDLPARQQTMRGAIAWSYDLLGPSERRLFARFAVFAGGAFLSEAEQVCAASGGLELDILDGLTSLSEKSLVRAITMRRRAALHDAGDRSASTAWPSWPRRASTTSCAASTRWLTSPPSKALCRPADRRASRALAGPPGNRPRQPARRARLGRGGRRNRHRLAPAGRDLALLADPRPPS